MAFDFSNLDLSKLQGMLGNLEGLAEKVREAQDGAAAIEMEGNAGAGLVCVRMNGKFEVLSVKFSERVALAPENTDDRALLEDLVAAATNDASRRVRAAMAERLGDLAGNLPLPPGFLGS
jgi:DNA-binding YbaB/EbfC family protein